MHLHKDQTKYAFSIFFPALSEIEENVSNVESAFFKISVAFSNLIDTGKTLRSKAINSDSATICNSFSLI